MIQKSRTSFLDVPLGAIFILRKGVFGLFQTTHPRKGIVSILTYYPQILRKIFENHLPPINRKINANIKIIYVILLGNVKVRCLHLHGFIMWQIVRTKLIFHQKFTSNVTVSNFVVI